MHLNMCLLLVEKWHKQIKLKKKKPKNSIS